MHISRSRTLPWGMLILIFSALPASADQTIDRGDDYWRTAGAGSTLTSFDQEPIPAGFFCPGSPPFTGTIALEGSPLASDPPGFLGSIDTVVRRLDDATFDERGVATTRLQFLAMSLASLEPVDTGCEQPFDVTVSLAGEQPVTEMKILRRDEDGGTYIAPLALRVRVAFAAVSGAEGSLTREPLTLYRDIRLGPGTNSVWTTSDLVGTTAWGEPVLVDTDGDQVADAVLPGPSNFVGSILPTAGGGGFQSETCGYGCPAQSCHCTPGGWDPNEGTSGCAPAHAHCIMHCSTANCPQ